MMRRPPLPIILREKLIDIPVVIAIAALALMIWPFYAFKINQR